MKVLVINGSPKGDNSNTLKLTIGQGKELPDDLVKKASEPLLPQRAFETLVNNYWNSCE